jgi:DNA invertase Pin-like site-specific DNA recombinase
VLQTDALARAKCDEVFADNGTSGTVPAREREGFAKLWGKLRAGDTVVVWKLDRLGRNTRDVLGVVEALEAQGVNLESVQDKIDTSGPMGRAMLTVMMAFAQLERDTIAERTRAGLEAARVRGSKPGRKVVEANDPRVAKAREYRERRGFTVEETAHVMHVGVATVYRWQKLWKAEGNAKSQIPAAQGTLGIGAEAMDSQSAG